MTTESEFQVGRAPVGAMPERRRDRWARAQVFRRLEGLAGGSLEILEGKERTVLGRGPNVGSLRVHGPAFYWRTATGGSIGAAESYIDGEWSSPDLVALIRLLARNVAIADDLETGLHRLVMPFRRLQHWLRRNHRANSRRNIHEHYDLGNAFFRLFLDPTMTYSCGLFETPQSSLEDSQVAKIDRICRKLDLGPEDHLVEIGTGWGGLSLHAARRYGCRVTTTTISREQYEHARALVEREGLSHRVEVVMSDYRDLTGEYDKLVSVEMIEAVGAKQYPTFFRTCARLLKPEGQMLIQAITIADQRYERALHAVDFIQRHVFPGSCIPSVTALQNAATRASDLRFFHMEELAPHYARTLESWRRGFLARLPSVREQGFDDRFIRLWEFYLAYCEAGFAERQTGLVQILMTRQACRRAPLLGDLAVTPWVEPAPIGAS